MPSIKIDRVAHNRECEIQRNVGDIESIGEYTDHQQELDIKRDRTLTDSLVCVGVCWCVRAREMREKCEEHQHQPRRGPQSRTCLSFSRAFRCGRAAESNLAALSLEIRASSRHIERPRWAGLHRARYRQPAANSLGGSENWSAVRIQHRSAVPLSCTTHLYRSAVRRTGTAQLYRSAVQRTAICLKSPVASPAVHRPSPPSP